MVYGFQYLDICHLDIFSFSIISHYILNTIKYNQDQISKYNFWHPQLTFDIIEYPQESSGVLRHSQTSSDIFRHTLTFSGVLRYTHILIYLIIYTHLLIYSLYEKYKQSFSAISPFTSSFAISFISCILYPLQFMHLQRLWYECVMNV